MRGTGIITPIYLNSSFLQIVNNQVYKQNSGSKDTQQSTLPLIKK